MSAHSKLHGTITQLIILALVPMRSRLAIAYGFSAEASVVHPSFIWLLRQCDCGQCCYCWWSMQDETLNGSQAKAAKAFSDYIKQETTKLESGAVTKPKYSEIDEEEEVEASAVKLAHSCMRTCTSSSESAVLSLVHHTCLGMQAAPAEHYLLLRLCALRSLLLQQQGLP